MNTIHNVARESLQEMRRVLHVLHEDHDSPAPEPPTIRDIDRLVAQFHSGGVRIEVRVCGSLDDLPAGLDLTAYRIVQEALTNVRKHAGQANATLTVPRLEAVAAWPGNRTAGRSHRATRRGLHRLLVRWVQTFTSGLLLRIPRLPGQT